MIHINHKRGVRSPRPSADRPNLSVLRGGFLPPPFVDRPIYYLERFSSCSFVALRGQKEVAVAVAVLRGPPCPPRTNVLPLQFFLDLSVLRGQKRFSPPPFVDRPNYYLERFSSCSFVFLRGQKEVAVAVAVLRGPPCPPRTKVLPLQFSAALRVLRGQMCCRCSSPRPSVSSVEKGVAVAVLRGPSWPFVDKCFAVAVLRGPSWIDQTMTLQISVQKTVNEP